MNSIFEIIVNKIKLAQNFLFPAFLFALALVSFYFNLNFSEPTLLILHIAFYGISFTTCLTLVYFNQQKPFFFILSMVLAYIGINYLKNNDNIAYFHNLSTIIAVNMALFYFMPKALFLSRKSLYFLILIFFEISLIEHLGESEIYFPPEINYLLFSVVLISFFISSSLSGAIFDNYLFFAGLSIAAGTYYAGNPSALSVFFCISSFIILVATGKELYFSTYRDFLSGLASRTSYIIDSKNFPLKYSIGIISIDNYDKLISVFGRMGTNRLTKMIAGKIQELEKENPVYRYSEDEFIVVYKNIGKEEGFKMLDAIRKAVASSEFVLSKRKKRLKLTISGSITEKKRSDANSVEVLQRAKKSLQNTNQFAQNFTSKS